MIDLQNLSVSIHDTPILQDVGLSIAPGQVIGLVGESGSGKSMTALAVMGLLPRGAKASGQIMFDGLDLNGLDDDALCSLRGRRISMIFQEPMTALNPVQTIGDQVAECARIHRTISRDGALRLAAEKLTRVGLPQDRVPLDRYPHELSGGQRQRVCIAMAIALHPDLLIADEPTTALDVTTQAQILDLLKELVAEEGMGLLLITHDLAVVAGMADRVAVMRKGKIVEQGETEILFRTMSHPYTRQLLEASNHAPAGIAQPSAAPLLQVNNAIRDYPLPRTRLLGPAPQFRAVDGVSFTLNKGESLGLVGESGCGKSTLSRAILGLEALQGGDILLNGDPISPDMDTARRAGLQVVFQDPYGSFNPRWKVEKLVAEPFHLLGARPEDWRDQVRQALAEVGLPGEAMTRYPHEFSGGQRQRIAIARALILRPELIVLDEAVSALDVSIRADILDLLADLQAKHGLAYLFISHDLGVVRNVTGRVLVMRAGQIVEEGETETVFTTPQHDYTRNLINAAPKIPPAWRTA
ncbi:peptide/nickel transport system ATP-binding protein [Aliiroseovarius halocynthiae]|uniref:ABC transporter ATP-binding protein n=1 Tax=Aliiroseovarius halocynthiae TaxID=985055 RepID=A0A545SUC5_9RHOB|nr:dipeptide ABC transporter ATP-binding protein [Aliiroseovarius halocynthiae]TQV68547.1 ABC transporter ATP-binding protein [Aliiroseovarius halocynthiae]SMR70951.1 peptide/nickel transport system ATP-binding protein [Aliiroseovarius halocynthiae]